MMSAICRYLALLVRTPSLYPEIAVLPGRTTLVPTTLVATSFGAGGFGKANKGRSVWSQKVIQLTKGCEVVVIWVLPPKD